MSELAADAMTYVPRQDEAARLTDLLARLTPVGGGSNAALVGPEGASIELPDEVFQALVAVVRAMAHGEGISVIPRSQQLSTQQAADILGVSRPTVVRLLEGGEISFEKHGRHRKVRLSDLVAYQQRARKERRGALDEMAAVGQALGMYDATSGPPPRAR